MLKTIRISQHIHAVNFLGRIWRDKDVFENYEWYGFSQFFYITLCCHFEAFVKDRICIRLDSVRRAHLTAEKVRMIGAGVPSEVNHAPVLSTITQLALSLKKDVSKLSFQKLMDFHEKVFGEKVEDVLGKETYQIIAAISDLRNVYAHGADFLKEYKSGQLVKRNQVIGVVSKVPALQEYLKPDADIDKVNFQEVFSSQEVMRYFYEATQAAVEKLGASYRCDEDASRGFVPPLPGLR